MDFMEIKSRLLTRLGEFANKFPQEQFEHMQSLGEAGELRLCFETLCELLYEYDISISSNLLEEITTLGTRMSCDPDLWSDLSIE